MYLLDIALLELQDCLVNISKKLIFDKENIYKRLRTIFQADLHPFSLLNRLKVCVLGDLFDYRRRYLIFKPGDFLLAD
jgi:hypothetical protein